MKFAGHGDGGEGTCSAPLKFNVIKNRSVLLTEPRSLVSDHLREGYFKWPPNKGWPLNKALSSKYGLFGIYLLHVTSKQLKLDGKTNKFCSLEN